MEDEKKTTEKPEGQEPPVITRSMAEPCETCEVQKPEVPKNLPDASWSTQKLIEATKDGNLLMRSNAIMLLSKRSPDEVVEPMVQALKDDEYIVKTNAMVALASFGRSMVERMIEALSDPNPDIRAGAAWVLGELKDQRAVESLEKVAKDEYPLARIQAKASLMAMGRGPKREEAPAAEEKAEEKAEQGEEKAP